MASYTRDFGEETRATVANRAASLHAGPLMSEPAEGGGHGDGGPALFELPTAGTTLEGEVTRVRASVRMSLLGVEALPYLSVCVMKSGTGAAEEGAAASGWADAAAAMGVFCAPGLRRSALPRMPAGVLLWAEDAGVVVSV